MKHLIFVLVIFALMLVMSSSAFAVLATLNIQQLWQHKDTNMWCNVCNAGIVHPQNDATVCAHCGMYCAPAACAMYAAFEGRVAPFINQDNIYDNGKHSQGETPGDGIIQTHGVGMYAGTGVTPSEVQAAFSYAVGIQPYQFGPAGGNTPIMDAATIKWFIDHNQPILWIDIGGWPPDQTGIPTELYYDSGHCKIIAGYNDLSTKDPNDDRYLIYDPWPTSGSPYWVMVGTFNFATDIFLTMGPVVAVEHSTWGSIKINYGK